MRSASSPSDPDWRDELPPYGQPAVRPAPITPERRSRREPRRRSNAGAWLIALAVGAAISALAVSNLHDPRSLGTQLDDAVANVRNMGAQAGQTLADSQSAVVEGSRDAVNGVSTAIDDAAISVKVKTALAADPALSAARIVVTTTQGIVRLDGPAPDAAAKERATVLAGAPRGVLGVDNRLSLPQAGHVVAVAEGLPRITAPAAAVVPPAAPAVVATPAPAASAGP